MVQSIVDQNLGPLLLAANVSNGEAVMKVAYNDEGPLLEVLSKTSFGATAVWTALRNRLQTASDHTR